jgi:dephospho-CoA kinase
LPNDNNPFKHAIVLTGGIATGKSTVASLFMLHGFLTIDADKIAHQVLDENIDSISDLFGYEYISDGKVDRKKLGNLVFNNKKEKEKLEKLVHPLIKGKIIAQAAVFEKNRKPYLIDIPLFFEKGNYNIEKSIVVYIPKQMQIERLMKRDNCTYEDALSRINNQMDIEEKRLKATYVIDNTKDLKSLQNEVERLKSILID